MSPERDRMQASFKLWQLAVNGWLGHEELPALTQEENLGGREWGE